MPRSPLALAALSTVAIPGLDAFDVRRPAHPSGDVDTAVVIDAQGRRWVVRAPQNAAAGAALEAEVALLEALVTHADAGRIPFDVPRPAGFAPLPEGGRAVVHPQLPGRPLRLENLGPGPGLAAAVGRAIAALHELPHSTIEDAGLPVYDADAYRRRRLAEVDEAAGTGHVPVTLLRRWERALEDVALWRFQPTVVHGDLSAEHVLCSADAPTGILGWSEAKVADPADDLAWLLVAAPQEAVDPILEAYSLRRTELSDHHLAARALLAGELALARWLLHGVRTGDEEIVQDARAMLVELDEHTHDTAHGPDGAPGPSRQTAARGSDDDDVLDDDGVLDDDALDDGTDDASPDASSLDDAPETDAPGASPEGDGPDGAGAPGDAAHAGNAPAPDLTASEEADAGAPDLDEERRSKDDAEQG
ncbi:phosphotransferase [Actinotalea subterranea]|uniref:phosphotransferase n=1 Tax=Actinotalea subterranea TaxID=2607497 RepID=UPI001CAA85EF|nr:phosphotransferase [Actinotalea subterranea]